MSLPETKTPPSKETYHQILPHFILRQFHFVPSDRLRQKIRNSWRTCNVPGERLFVYDLTTGQLQQRPVPKVYGKLKVLKDIKNSTDVEYVESKLKDLEDEAATIVRAIHYGSQGGGIKLSRGRLSILRKFIFVTCYRGLAVQFQEAGVEKGGKNPLLYAWLQGLKYYLDTPHHDIVATGEKLRERYGNRLPDVLRTRSYPESEELDFQYAIDYEGLANYYVLGVWVAAEESEFVLGGRAFSHYEGHIGGISWAHRLHVLTPRIAIILRRTCLLNPTFNDPSLLHSALADVPIPRPDIQYAKEDLNTTEVDPAQVQLAMNAYRTKPEAEQDSFKYSFTQLSPEQTYAVNQVILMSANLRHRGSIIFRKPSIMQETLDRYKASPHTSLGGKQKLFHPLLEQLRDLKFEDDSQRSQVRSSSPPESENESTADCQLNLLFGTMIKNHIKFTSTYTRAFFIFHMVTMASSSNPISQEMSKIQDAAIEKLRSLLDPPSPEDLGDMSGLVESLADEESELFFSFIGGLLDQASVSIGRSNDLCATVIKEAAIIGVTYWLAEERPDVLREILTPWVPIWA